VQPDETTVGFLEHAIRDPNEGDAIDAETLNELRADAQELGLFGLLAAASLGLTGPAGEGGPAVRDELSAALASDLRDALGERDATASLSELCARYRAEKGEQGPTLLARLAARVIYQLYGLADHGFLQDDVLQVGALLAAGDAQGSAREAARRATRLGRYATRTVLGHLDSQLDIVHRLGNSEQPLVWSEIDRRLDEFAPRIYAQRWPSMARRLLIDDKRFRFVVVLWARLRGVVIGRAGLVEVAARIEPKRPMLFVQCLVEGAHGREALRGASADSSEAALITSLFAAV